MQDEIRHTNEIKRETIQLIHIRHEELRQAFIMNNAIVISKKIINNNIISTPKLVWFFLNYRYDFIKRILSDV